MKKSKVSILTNKKHVIALIAIISLLITVSGYFYYKHQENLIRQQKYTELKMITDLKQSQIEQWLKQRNADVKLVAQSPFFIKGIEQWLKDTGNVQLKLDIIELLEPVQKEQGYENIILAASNGQLLISVKPGFEDIDTFPKQHILESTQKEEIVFTDIYWCETENREHYDIIAPVINSGKKTIAVLLFRRELKSFLYPLLQTWPMPSKSAETYLVRVEGDSVHFLNNLRFRANSALTFKIPLTRTEVTAVQAASGRTGIFEGIDYRDVEVLADMRRIPAANWIMVSKIDKSEIYSGLFLTAGVIFGFSIFLIIICGVGFALIYSSRQKNIFLELYGKERELWQQQEKFEVTINSFGDGVITADSNGKIQYLNKMAQELTGWNFREARGRMLGEVYTVKNEETGQIANDILEKVNKQGIIKELANHTILTSKSGKEIPVMDTGAPIYDNDGSTIGIVIVFEDETEKRRQLKLLKGSEFRLRSTLDSMMEGCQIIGFDFRYLFLNKAALIQSKLAKEEILAKTMMECYPGIENTKMFSALRYCMEKRIKASMENEFLYPDGAKRIFQLRFEPVPEGTFILSEDITERKQAEEKIRHVNRALSVLSNTNQAIVRIKDKQELFHEVCRIAVESGKFRMTWIGMLDVQTKKVNPVASAGSAEEYLKTTTIDLSDEKLCNGPTGRAITSGVHFLANDIANNPEMMPWRENALTHGYKSSAAFPIKVFGKTIGAFMLYSSETFFFDGDEVKLFDEMVMDISFALEKSETEKKINVAEIKLLKSEKRFNKLVTELNDIVWTASLDGTEIVDVNNSIETVCGITVDEFKTNPKLWLEMVHPDDRHTAETSSKELLENGKNQAEYRIIKPDGSVVWLLDSKTLIFNEEGIPIQRGGIVKDITKRKLAEQGLIIANAELTFQNEEKEKRAAELVIANAELALQNEEKEKRAAELVIANAELALQNEEKEKRAAELLVAIEKAGEMNRLKSNFLANMSHELRTPLIGINGYADFLRNDIVEPELKEMAETIFISGSRLTETINLILDLSKFESEKVEFNYQNVDIVNETGNIINLFKEAARKKSIDLQSTFSQPSIFCHTDELAFRSVLNNLVNNAIKYTYEGCVAVNISQNSTSVEIKVTDTGIGIPKEFHETIFDEFRQVSEGLNRNFEGTGIGLNVTKRIVEKFNGELSVESESGRGSTFTVKLPFIDKSENKETETVIEEALTVEIIEQKSVKPLGLLVDDDPFIYPLLRRYITKQVNLENAKDGESAIKLCMQKQYDIVFMDINLRRGLDGTEVTQIIRKINGYESIPVIATTAYAMDGDKEEFIAAGCSHYMSKPFSQKDALDLLEEIQNNL